MFYNSEYALKRCGLSAKKVFTLIIRIKCHYTVLLRLSPCLRIKHNFSE